MLPKRVFVQANASTALAKVAVDPLIHLVKVEHRKEDPDPDRSPQDFFGNFF